MSLFDRKIKYKPVPVSADQFFISDSENENVGLLTKQSQRELLRGVGAIYIYSW